ncbi:MAG: TIGR02757 family protein, partial [Syntrophobacterales bacterium]|nr:TIGR02757 family protein [Syntrophobacterales bacterium]
FNYRGNSLLPSPAKGSACKRLNLFLRWMVRHDDVDPGGWDDISSSKLIIPLDTHMHRICLALGITKRKQADMKTALEITRSFQVMAPHDPVRYDFALTRLGIRKDTDITSFLYKFGRNAEE